MPLYYDIPKRKRPVFYWPRWLKFSTALLAAGMLLLIAAPFFRGVQSSEPQPFAPGVYGVALETYSPASDSLQTVFMTALAEALRSEGFQEVLLLPESIDSPVTALKAGERYHATLVIYVDEGDTGYRLHFSLTDAPYTLVDVDGDFAPLSPWHFSIPTGMTTNLRLLARLIQGMAVYETGDYAAAADLLEPARGTPVNYDDLSTMIAGRMYFYRANALFMLGRYGDAEFTYRRAGSVMGQDSWLLLNQGHLAYVTGDYLGAMQLYAATGIYVNQTLTAALAAYYQGRAAEQVGLYREALRSYERVLQTNPSYAPALERYERIKTWLNAMMQVYPQPATGPTRDPNVYLERAQGYMLRGDYAAALRQVNEALRLDPTSAYMYNLRGYLRHLTGDYEGAAADFSASIRLQPQQAYALMGRGYAEAAQGNMVLATADFEQARRVDPNYAGTFIAWGLAYQQQGDVRRAGEMFKKWIAGMVQRGYGARFVGNQAEIDMSEGHVVYLSVSAKAGQLLSITAAAHNPYELDPLIVIMDSKGSPIAGNDDRIINQDFNAEISYLTLPADGQYNIMVSHAGGGSEGRMTVTYSLR